MLIWMKEKEIFFWKILEEILEGIFYTFCCFYSFTFLIHVQVHLSAKSEQAPTQQFK